MATRRAIGAWTLLLGGGLATLLCLLGAGATARAGEGDGDALFVSGAQALKDGRVGDAIDAFEAFADRGMVDATASYDRGLAYAERVRIGAERPGDLGRAAHGFEEARDLSKDPGLVADAERGLTAVRGEVARRRLRAGQPVEVDPGRSLSRTLAGLLVESTWAAIALAASAALGLGLFVRWLARHRRVRVGGGLMAGVAGPALAFAVAMTSAARHDRLGLVEAIVVSSTARPIDERGVIEPGSNPLPEGARVEIVREQGASTRVRFGAIDAWLPAGSLRPLAK
jgi:hypothetical protein